MPQQKCTCCSHNVQAQRGIIQKNFQQSESDNQIIENAMMEPLVNLQEKLKEAEHLSKEEQMLLIEKIIKMLYEYLPWPEQTDSLWWLVFQRMDMLLVARTSFGKSMMLQVLFCLVSDSIIIIILLLLAIESEQLKKISQLPFAKPIFVNAMNAKNRILLWNIQNCKYTHILLSSEILTEIKFCDILWNLTFWDCLK